MLSLGLLLPLLGLVPAQAILTANETASTITLSNARLRFELEKASGYMTTVALDGLNLLGDRIVPTDAIGPYLDGIFTSKQKVVSVGKGAAYTVLQGKDSAGVGYGGVVITQDAPDGNIGACERQVVS
jgi:rhamnogalacturonan endolyase